MNIGKKFFKLINRHFSKHKMSKILSYSHCKNLGSVIRSTFQIRRVIHSTFNNQACYCRNKAEYSLSNKCLTTKIVYQAVLSVPSKPETAFKGALSGLRQFLATESTLEIMKNAFYFTQKALFFLKIFKFLF